MQTPSPLRLGGKQSVLRTIETLPAPTPSPIAGHTSPFKRPVPLLAAAALARGGLAAWAGARWMRSQPGNVRSARARGCELCRVGESGQAKLLLCQTPVSRTRESSENPLQPSRERQVGRPAVELRGLVGVWPGQVLEHVTDAVEPRLEEAHPGMSALADFLPGVHEPEARLRVACVVGQSVQEGMIVALAGGLPCSARLPVW